MTDSLTRVLGIGLMAAIVSVILKQQKPEFSIAIPILGAGAILLYLAPYVKELLVMFERMATQSGLESRYLRMVIKIIGVAYLCQFAAELCKDAGEAAMASKIELAGKIMILALSMPMIERLLDLVSTMIHF